MSMVRSGQGNAWLPEDYGKVLSLAVEAKSVAAQTSTVVRTNRESIGFPLWVSDPTVAFYNELDEISLSDGDTDEVVIVPKKTAGLVLASSELLDDSDPSIADSIGHGLANQLAKAVDVAWAANTTTKAYNGLLSKATTTVDSGVATLANLDAFVSARFAAEAHGAHLTHWVLDPAVAETLSNLKVASGSNQPLLQFVEDGITIAGLPVITTTDVDANTQAFGIDKTQQRLVIRQGATVEKFPSVTNDGWYLRGIMRVGWDTLNPAGIVRIWNATP